MTYIIIKRLVLLLLICAIEDPCYSQKTEVKATAYSGLFFFTGSGAVYSTKITHNDNGYFNAYPYGKKSSFSYSIELQTQRITKAKFIYGAGIGYENLKTKVDIDSVSSDIGERAATGQVILINEFIMINPFVGRRFNINKLTLDIIAGADIAFVVNITEVVRSGTSKSRHWKDPYFTYYRDNRARIQLNASYNRFGISAGYSRGTVNLFHTGYSYLNKEVFAHYLRLGVSYKLK